MICWCKTKTALPLLPLPVSKTAIWALLCPASQHRQTNLNLGLCRCHNLFSHNLFSHNLFSHNLFSHNLFSHNLFSHNLFNRNLFNRNLFNRNLFNRNLFSQYPFSQYRPPKPLSRAAAATKPSMPPFQAA